MSFLRKRLFLSLTVISTVALSLFFLLNEEKVNFDTQKAEKRNIVREISVLGKVVPSESASLAFERSGRIISAKRKVGDVVSRDEIVARIDDRDLQSALQEAEASWEAERSKLLELKRGTRAEEIEVQRKKVQSAAVTLQNAHNVVSVAIKDAYTKSDDAIRNKADALFENPQSAIPKITFPSYSTQLKTAAEQERAAIEKMIFEWKEEIEMLSVNNIDKGEKNAKERLETIKNFLDKLSFLLNSAIVGSEGLTQTTVDLYRSDISVSRNTVQTLIQVLSDAIDKQDSARVALRLSESELALKEAGTLPETIAAQESRIDQALFKTHTILADIEKAVLRSPIEGVISRQDAVVGEVAQAHTPLIEIEDRMSLEIEAFIPETDIGEMSLGATGRTTLDAYRDNFVFQTVVHSVDPSATIVEGVSTYKTIFSLRENDARVRSGMTANIDVLIEERKDVVAIPRRFITLTNVGGTVLLFGADGTVIERDVTVGLLGSGGYVEITDGLKEGETVLVQRL